MARQKRAPKTMDTPRPEGANVVGITIDESQVPKVKTTSSDVVDEAARDALRRIWRVLEERELLIERDELGF